MKYLWTNLIRLLLLILCMGTGILHTSAQEAFMVSPAEGNHTIHVGGEGRSTITLDSRNEQAYLMLVSQEFSTYYPVFGNGFSVYETDLSVDAYSWLKLPYEMVQVLPNEKTQFDYEIKVPEYALPGTYYFAIHFSEVEEVGRKGTSFSIPVTLRVTRQRYEQIEVGELLLLEHSHDERGNEYSLRIPVKNIGTLPIRLGGQVELLDESKDVMATLDLESAEGVVNPNTSTVYVGNWAERLTGGIPKYARYTFMSPKTYSKSETVELQPAQHLVNFEDIFNSLFTYMETVFQDELLSMLP